MQSFCNTCIKLAFVITHCNAGAFGDKNIFNRIFFMHFKNECEQHVIRGKIPCNHFNFYRSILQKAIHIAT